MTLEQTCLTLELGIVVLNDAVLNDAVLNDCLKELTA